MRNKDKLFKKLKIDYERLTTVEEKRKFKRDFFKLKLCEDTLSEGWDYITLGILEKENYLTRKY